MKFSEIWLREWVNPSLSRDALGNLLTMSGFEVEEILPVSETFSHVIIGQIVSIKKHPNSEQLNICSVDIGKQKKKLQIVCGASNVLVGMKVAVALDNAVLPHNKSIKTITMKGVSSEGMICSSAELGLSEENQGILELPRSAAIGKDIRTYLKLDDHIFNIAITPNRGDCLSIRGLAREISALTKSRLKEIVIPTTKSSNKSNKESFKVTIRDVKACPRYVGRIIRGVRTDIKTPLWLQECLRRSGTRAIHPIVDVMNYVMFELGQPMHAFDLNKIQNEIIVRHSKMDERIALLDGSDKTLNSDTLVIADKEKPLAIAGVMGGIDSSVTSETQDIFLESAYFSPEVIAKQSRYYHLISDSGYRFERGVDPHIQREAIERATQLIVELVGGKPGPLIEKSRKEYLPKKNTILLNYEKIGKLLGISITKNEVEAIFKGLNFSWTRKKQGWLVSIPSYRFDMTQSEDIIEEIARLYGYDHIPTHPIAAKLEVNRNPENEGNLHAMRQAFCDQGFHEIITYSFVDQKLQNLLDPQETARELVNPITSDMTVMRTNLWPGLINSLLYNKSRQQHRIRLFEIGTCFTSRNQEILQQPRIAGLLTGLAFPEQWGSPARIADFFDLKGHVTDVLSFMYHTDFVFKPDVHKALHPGQCAAIYYKEQKIGLLGALHPLVMQTLELLENVYVFELDLNQLAKCGKVCHFQEISKFPEIRRDISIIVNQAIPAKDIQATIRGAAGDWLKDVFIFDVYQGKGISVGYKSVALALILQHPTRTLVDDEVTELMNSVMNTLKGHLGAELRS